LLIFISLQTSFCVSPALTLAAAIEILNSNKNTFFQYLPEKKPLRNGCFPSKLKGKAFLSCLLMRLSGFVTVCLTALLKGDALHHSALLYVL
jgi:hypothetical protein